jgi:hypothetical protein
MVNRFGLTRSVASAAPISLRFRQRTPQARFEASPRSPIAPSAAANGNWITIKCKRLRGENINRVEGRRPSAEGDRLQMAGCCRECVRNASRQNACRRGVHRAGSGWCPPHLFTRAARRRRRIKCKLRRHPIHLLGVCGRLRAVTVMRKGLNGAGDTCYRIVAVVPAIVDDYGSGVGEFSIVRLYHLGTTAARHVWSAFETSRTSE